MIVGVKNVDAYEVVKHCNNALDLRNYSDSLVPRILRHDMRIVHNQRYLVAMVVRNIKSIPWTSRKELCEELLEGVAVSGLINKMYDFDDLMMAVDLDKLALFIKKGGLKSG